MPYISLSRLLKDLHVRAGTGLGLHLVCLGGAACTCSGRIHNIVYLRLDEDIHDIADWGLGFKGVIQYIGII